MLAFQPPAGSQNDPRSENFDYEPESTVLSAEFKRRKLPFHTSAQVDPADKYTTWEVTHDASLHQGSDEFQALATRRLLALGGRWQDGMGGSWVDKGIELVSRPMPALELTSAPHEQEGWREARAYYEALNAYADVPASGSAENGAASASASASSIEAEAEAATTSTVPPFVAFQTAQCGLHIHIGQPNNACFPLLLVQHLAVLLLIYEDVFHLLHPPHRTPLPGTQAGQFAQSNRLGFVAENAHTCEGSQGPSTAVAKKAVFACGEMWKLCALMGGGMLAVDVQSEDQSRKIEEEKEKQRSRSASLASRRESEQKPLFPTEVSASVFSSSPSPAPSKTQDSGYASLSRSSRSASICSASSSTRAFEEGLAKLDLSASPPPPQVKPPHRNWNDLPGIPEWSASARDFWADEVQNASGEADTRYVPNIEAKYRICRFELLCQAQRPQTIEFRQPAGTLDHREAAFTVQLYIALVRAAERRMLREDNGEVEEGDEETGTLEGLLRVLQLPGEVEDFWRVREREMEVLREEEREKARREGRRIETCFKCASERSWGEVGEEVGGCSATPMRGRW